MEKRWWTQPFGLPPSAKRGSSELTPRQVAIARLSLVLVPLVVLAAVAVTSRWYLLILAAPPFYNLFVIMPPSQRRRILGQRSA